ncbi:D-arabinose 5-phosphate isomerase [hydrothermal vent metagenome]|uniref:D-arabinose 5-phosphate isomerase n=1 Tax=hydrothermal vent metagenome TaxID=652676 RepID=A0A3B0WYC8_9ZZZZ
MRHNKIQKVANPVNHTPIQKSVNPLQIKKLGLAVINTELSAVTALKRCINDDFVKACELMLKCKGRVVITGMGKSGHIGNKIAATLASTGTPAFFVHPGEASHGDLGMITPQDVVIALSNSGETGEILTILPILKRLSVPMISITGNAASSLSKEADINLDASVEKEACPLGLAPTSSTTVALVLGDALAVALLDARGFTENDFALSHPGGSLGKRLLLHVKDIMHTGNEIPQVKESASLRDALLEMTQKSLGMTAIVNEQQQVLGIYTDGDLRRTLDKNIDIHNVTINEVMTANCKTIQQQILAAEAITLMQKSKINAMLVVDDNNQLIGALNMHDFLRAGVV